MGHWRTIDALLADWPWTSRMALSEAGDADLAQDILQDLCVAAMECPPREPLHLRAWASCVVRRQVISLRRRERLLFNDAMDQVQGGGDDPLDCCALDEAREAIAEGILALPEDLRRPTILRYWKGLRRDQVAAIMGIDSRALDDRLWKARSRLRLKCVRQRLVWH